MGQEGIFNSLCVEGVEVRVEFIPILRKFFVLDPEFFLPLTIPANDATRRV